MPLTLPLAPEVEKELQALARAHGTTVEAVAAQVLAANLLNPEVASFMSAFFARQAGRRMAFKYFGLGCRVL